MDVKDFLRTVITTPPLTPEQREAGDRQYFCLALGTKRGQGWWEKWFEWPDQLDVIVALAAEASEEHNVYFSTYLFSTRSSQKEYVLPTRTIQADLDEADVLTLSPVPAVLVETSAGRHQGYWLVKPEYYSETVHDPVTNTDTQVEREVPIHSLEAHEILSRKLTYSIPLCDHSGWALGRKVRFPSTINHKYLEGPQQVRIAATSLKQYALSEYELLPDVAQVIVEHFSEEFLNDPPEAYPIGPNELLHTYKSRLPHGVVQSYNVLSRDRSRTLWALLCAGFRAGMAREEVYWLGLNTPNNKFADLHHNARRELAKDVLRAEELVKSKIPDERGIILEARKLPGMVVEKRQYILAKVQEYMRASGEFVRTPDDNAYYVRHDLGRPILISPRSEYFNMVLDLQFGLNPSEGEQQYVVNGLYSWTRNLPVNGRASALSYYDADSNALLLHTGKKDVLRITANAIERTIDGSYGVVFPWQSSTEPFSPTFSASTDDWGELLFGTALHNVIGIERAEAKALLQVWLMFLLFRSSSVSRPILALFGQPGSGKSTLFRRIYTVLYGRQKSLGAVTTPDDFDHATATEPLVVLDNVDTWEKWLPDRLALAASTSDIVVRKLYTDQDTITKTRSAILGITAHNPRFGREDVADRLVLLTFERLAHFLPEGDIITDILRKRNQIWGAICLDIQRVLQQPQPNYADVPQFRVEDFARIGTWIAQALGCAEAFHSGLQVMSQGSKAFNLEEDHLIVQSIDQYVRQCARANQWQTVSQLWTDLVMYSSDSSAFVKTYRNAVALNKKLWSLQESLNVAYSVDWKQEGTSSRLWRIGVSSDESTQQNGHSVPGTSSAHVVAGGSTDRGG